MSDDIDTLMTALWPALTKSAAAKLTKDKLSTCVPTELLADPRTARLDLAWAEVDEPKRQPGTVLKKCELRRPTLFAYEFAVDAGDLTMEQLKEAGLTRKVEELSTTARDQERAVVLQIICDSARVKNLNYIDGDVNNAIQALDQPGTVIRQYRLIGVGDPAILARRKAKVLDVVDPLNQLPDNFRGLLIAMVNGPIVQRIESDLTLTWRRMSSETVRLRIAERFFVVNAEESAALRR